MSSRRFPGKVLAPFRGRPLLDWVVEAVRTALPAVPIVVLTSQERSDEPIAHHLRAREVPVFRGPLDDVLGRFVKCLEIHPAEHILRVCADSPLASPNVLARVASMAGRADLVTTIRPRTFPKGQNAELIAADTLRAINQESALNVDDREHVTRYIHRHPEHFSILNVESGEAALAEQSVAVDTVEDLARLEALTELQLERLCGRPLP